MEQHYSIRELAAAAEVSVRTVRFYTAEGLLPPPSTQGRFAAYDQTHLQRLRLIVRLKAAYLPLGEIKNRLAALPDDAAPPDEPLDSAVDYLERILREQRAGYASAPPPAPPMSPAAPPGAPPRPAPAPPSSARPSAPAPPIPAIDAADAPPAPSTWQRIALADGVELHLRAPQPPELQPTIAALLAAARELFS